MKKIIALMLTLLISLSVLVACGGDDDDDDDDGPAVNTPSVEESTEYDNVIEFD